MFRQADPKKLKENVFRLIGDGWMLITAGTAERCNTMTASWGGLGVLWGGPAATVYLRPQRYTKQFVDREEYFTLSFFDERYREALNFCGSRSGREVDKAAECGLTVCAASCGAPYFEQARLVFVCRKRYAQRLDPEEIPGDIARRWYPERDFHWMYIGEIVETLVRD